MPRVTLSHSSIVHSSIVHSVEIDDVVQLDLINSSKQSIAVQFGSERFNPTLVQLGVNELTNWLVLSCLSPNPVLTTFTNLTPLYDINSITIV